MTRAVTVVISDLHVGGGGADPGDDHVFDRHQLVGLLERLAILADEAHAPLELVINGDFLEFAQVAPEVYTLGSADCWCSEDESLAKLRVILEGHPEIFDALRRFRSAYRAVTLVPGNHDVDLYWEPVRGELQDRAAVNFAVGQETLRRHRGRVVIEHGHMQDPANRFMNWPAPFVAGPGGELRLEMCPGTLFMVKFINELEHQYPFADNIKPITAFARFVLGEGRKAWWPIAWRLIRLAARHPVVTAGERTDPDDVLDLPARMASAFESSPDFRRDFVALHERVGGAGGAAGARARFASDEALGAFIELLVARVPSTGWMGVLERALPQTAGIARSGMRHEKELLAERAVELLGTGADVVVFGHTHQPDRWVARGKAYFNPGSWTRYVELDQMPTLTLDALRDQTRFPYALNYVWIEETDAGHLDARLECFERSP
jgi:UDP-2,3-diacylglucosamine pyrophosphatase LpxH